MPYSTHPVFELEGAQKEDEEEEEEEAEALPPLTFPPNNTSKRKNQEIQSTKAQTAGEIPA